MKLLITAGNTQAPIDRVRVVTNIFTGRTGANLARTAWARGHQVTVLTSHPETLAELPDRADDPQCRLTLRSYRTYDELAEMLHQEVREGRFDGILHAAAVSDFLCAGVYAPEPGTFFNARTHQWECVSPPPQLAERRAGKIKSHEPELWLRMVRAPKLIDRFRSAWGFTGLLVKFKLEVGLSDDELLSVAEESRRESLADLMVANTLDGADHYAWIGPLHDRYERVPRRELADRLILALEQIHREHRHRTSESHPHG